MLDSKPIGCATVSSRDMLPAHQEPSMTTETTQTKGVKRNLVHAMVEATKPAPRITITVAAGAVMNVLLSGKPEVREG